MDCMAMGWLAWLLGLAALVLIVLASVWIARQLFRGERDQSPSASRALNELELRYARGEIDRESYLNARQDLTGG
ncbi:MAG: SHOCT domain-containing protein [bacterium]